VIMVGYEVMLKQHHLAHGDHLSYVIV
jgi:hypothetical protein